jgi:hypothetical protein
VLALCVAAAPALAEDSEVVTETSLRPAPGAAGISAFLTAGTPVEILERADGWVRVQIEGWVKANTLVGSAPLPPPEQPTQAAPPPVPKPTPSPPPIAPATVRPESPPAAPAVQPVEVSSVEGLVQVQLGRRKRASAAGTPVMLLPAGVDLEVEGADRTETAARLAELDAEASRLESEAEKAMHLSNFTEASMLRDKLMTQRKAVLTERQDLLAAQHGRHEQVARTAALVTGVADAKGWFSLTPVPPGDYVLYARWVREDADLEWIEPLTVGDASVRIDLDSSRARGALAK